MKKALLFALFTTLHAISTSAANTPKRGFDYDELTFGIEFTATTDQNRHYSISTPDPVRGVVDYVSEAAEAFAKKTSGDIRPGEQGGKAGLFVENHSGEWFFHDDVGVLEVSSPVFQLHQLKLSRHVKELFTTFKECGLQPEVHQGGLHGGGGHIHVGVDAFIKHPRLLNRLIIDLHNRPYVQSTLDELFDDQSQSPFEILSHINADATDNSTLNTFLLEISRASDFYETLGFSSLNGGSRQKIY